MGAFPSTLIRRQRASRSRREYLGEVVLGTSMANKFQKNVGSTIENATADKATARGCTVSILTQEIDTLFKVRAQRRPPPSGSRVSDR
jgi:hypothetical protein